VGPGRSIRHSGIHSFPSELVRRREFVWTKRRKERTGTT
jgi:hypothetical protein